MCLEKDGQDETFWLTVRSYDPISYGIDPHKSEPKLHIDLKTDDYEEACKLLVEITEKIAIESWYNDDSLPHHGQLRQSKLGLLDFCITHAVNKDLYLKLKGQEYFELLQIFYMQKWNKRRYISYKRKLKEAIDVSETEAKKSRKEKRKAKRVYG